MWSASLALDWLCAILSAIWFMIDRIFFAQSAQSVESKYELA